VPPSIKSSIAEKEPKEFAFDQDFVCGHTPNPPLLSGAQGCAPTTVGAIKHVLPLPSTWPIFDGC
jgi:hypothetical protein